MVTRSVLIGSNDDRLAQMLASLSMRVSSLSRDDLSVLAQPDAPQPNVIVIDLRQETTVPPALRELKRNHRSTPVIMVASDLDPDLMLEAMRAGVNECVSEPVSLEDLDAALVRVASELDRPMTAGTIFAFVGTKGGVGATTTAVNVATALASQTRSPSPLRANTLFVDLHLSFGDAAEYFGVEPTFSVIDALENTHRLDETVFAGLVTETGAGVDLLASSQRPDLASADSEGIRTVLDFAASHYRYTVLDVPRASSTMLDALEAATRIVLVGSQELASVKNGSLLGQLLRQRYGDSRVAVMLTRYDRELEIGRDDVESALGVPIGHVIPNEYLLATAALHRGEPLCLSNHNRLAAGFQDVARDLSGQPARSQQPARPSGLLRRLTGRG